MQKAIILCLVSYSLQLFGAAEEDGKSLLSEVSLLLARIECSDNHHPVHFHFICRDPQFATGGYMRQGQTENCNNLPFPLGEEDAGLCLTVGQFRYQIFRNRFTGNIVARNIADMEVDNTDETLGISSLPKKLPEEIALVLKVVHKTGKKGKFVIQPDSAPNAARTALSPKSSRVQGHVLLQNQPAQQMQAGNQVYPVGQQNPPQHQPHANHPYNPFLNNQPPAGAAPTPWQQAGQPTYPAVHSFLNNQQEK